MLSLNYSPVRAACQTPGVSGGGDNLVSTRARARLSGTRTTLSSGGREGGRRPRGPVGLRTARA
jgi:hypothetical protein